MPVNKRAALSGREPLASDNDFTVLFERVPIAARGAAPPRITAPAPAPSPPAAPARPTPMVMAMAPAPPAGTVVVRPRLSVRMARVAVFLALGCALGVGVERVVRARMIAAWAVSRDSSPAASLAEVPASDAEGAFTPGAPAGAATGTRTRPHGAHHHHVHHPATTGTEAPGAAVDAGEDAGDDMAAAMEALTKAKGEVTLP